MKVDIGPTKLSGPESRDRVHIYLVAPGSVKAVPSSFSVFLEPVGGLHDMQGHHIPDGWWAQTFAKDREAQVKAPFVIVMGLPDEKTTPLSALTKELVKIKSAADPSRETIVYVQLEGLLPETAKGP